MTRVLLLGIDAMDSFLLEKYRDKLPTMARLMEEGSCAKPVSIFPPDTPSAWTTIYTGLNPAKHGNILFVDPLVRVSTMAFQEVDNGPIRGRAFWDIAGAAGKSVCILMGELCYPVWPVNGIMIGRSSRIFGDRTPVEAFPDSLQTEVDIRKIARVKAPPEKKAFNRHVAAHRKLVENELSLGLDMFRRAKWDVFFLYSQSLDWIGHNLWSYMDDTDPSYPGPNEFENTFLEFYQLYDHMVGEFIATSAPDTCVVVFSDHGQGIRPLKLANINEVLRQNGLLAARAKTSSVFEPVNFVEAMKGFATSIFNKYGVGKIATGIIHALPFAKRLYTAPPSIDWRRTVAYVTDLSGIKAYSYGGIRISKSNLAGRDYEQVRGSIIALIGDMKEPETGSPLAKWVKRREDVYSGEFIDRYPDVVFHLRDDYGVGWAVNQPTVGVTRTHNIQPGSHKMDTPVFMIHNLSGRALARRDMTLMDVAPTVLDLIGVSSALRFDGESILVRPESPASVEKRL